MVVRFCNFKQTASFPILVMTREFVGQQCQMCRSKYIKINYITKISKRHKNFVQIGDLEFPYSMKYKY